jgi:hypothetical protein
MWTKGMGMKRCPNDECSVGYECNPEGSSFLSIEDYLAHVDSNATGDLWGYEVFKYCPECGCKVEDIFKDYKKKLSV